MKKSLQVIAITVQVIIATSSCQENVSKDQIAAPSQPEIVSSEESKVDTYVIKLNKFNYLLQCVGKIKARDELRLLAENNGLIKFYNVRDNLKVNAGTTLLKFDTKAIELKIDKANELVYNSRLNYQSDLLSQASLLEKKSKGIKDSVYRKLRSNAGLSNAESDLKDLQLELSKTVVKAPFSGTLASVKVHNGQYVRAGDELLTIYSSGDLFLEGKVMETDIGHVKIGQFANVVPISGSGLYKAVVDGINPIVDENGLITVKLKLLQVQGLINGMNASATIMEDEQKCLSVPKKSIVMRGGKAVVFTMEDGLAKWNYVTLGRDNGKEYEILNGLKAGDKVIISNNLQLAHDAPVKEK